MTQEIMFWERKSAALVRARAAVELSLRDNIGFASVSCGGRRAENVRVRDQV